MKVTIGTEQIRIERLRQIEQEGFTPELDERYGIGCLTSAAICYLDATTNESLPGRWPFASDMWKPTTHIRNLEKAGALAAAEIDKIKRQQGIFEVGVQPEEHENNPDRLRNERDQYREYAIIQKRKASIAENALRDISKTLGSDGQKAMKALRQMREVKGEQQ